ncbi:cellulase-like family protein [Streptomyces sp. NPDC059740]|uniref:cellulase-like family protein n=1 Tax=Streptomyces sp. NPDC059740 TaxID=3346926 RepID=UPI0036463FE5
MPTAPPAHLPARLTLTLWDFTWYTRTGPGEPFADLDRAFAEAVERGYNTVRVCAMPYLLFGSGLDTTALRLGPLGGGLGQRTRWYDVRAGTTIDARARLLQLFEAARRHDCFVVLSSWEYQQSPSFATDPAWWDALRRVEPERRAEALAEALADLVDFLAAHGLADRVVCAELHNEAQGSLLAEGLDPDRTRRVVALRPRLERGIEAFKKRHPDHLVALDYAGVPLGALRGVPRTADVLVFHPYVYGVLGELNETFAVRNRDRPFPQQAVRRELLRAGAPDLAEWTLPPADRWKLAATTVGQRELYLHDWCDPERFDAWLYDRYALHRPLMEERLRTWIAAAADRAAETGVPLVLGEGWVGYTPLHGTFEEGPAGAALCRLAVAEAARTGAWGTVVCSNAAPHHPMWADVALQKACNEAFRAA